MGLGNVFINFFVALLTVVQLAHAQLAWPGGSTVDEACVKDYFEPNLSGLSYVSNALMWAVKNKPSKVYKLAKSTVDGLWRAWANNSWSDGKIITMTNSSEYPDSEGVTVTSGTDSFYVCSERIHGSGISRNSILKYVDDSTTTLLTTLVADQEWLIPLTQSDSNAGLEAIAFLPDSYLTDKSFYDSNLLKTYNPADYSTKESSGLFAVGYETGGNVYIYALHTNSDVTLIQTVTGGGAKITGLFYDSNAKQLWGLCDGKCDNTHWIFQISSSDGRMKVTASYAPPYSTRRNTEGISIGTPNGDGTSNVYWADDDETSGYAITEGTVPSGTLPIPCQLGLEGDECNQNSKHTESAKAWKIVVVVFIFIITVCIGFYAGKGSFRRKLDDVFGVSKMYEDKLHIEN